MGKKNKPEVNDVDLNAIEEVPRFEPQIKVWCVEKKAKKGEEESKASKKKKGGVAKGETLECENEKCIKKKIKPGELIFTHYMEDTNRQSNKEWDGVPTMECFRCAFPKLFEQGADLDKIKGWDEMDEVYQDAGKKAWWKDKAKFNKKMAKKASRAESITEEKEDSGLDSQVQNLSIQA